MACATNQAQFKAAMDLRYKAPADATPEGIRKAEELIVLPKVAKTKNGVRPPDLDVICRPYDSKPSQRFIPGRGSKLRNKAFLIALILKGMGYESAIMPEWWIPEDKEPQIGKRNSPEPVPPYDGSTATELDWDNPARCASVGVVECHASRSTLFIMDIQCSLPMKAKKQRRLYWHPCFDIKLWVGYASSTDEERAAHQDKHIGRMMNGTFSRPGPHRLESCNRYQVQTHG